MDYYAQRAMAQGMYAAMDAFVQSAAMKVDWTRRLSVVDRLRHWIRHRFIPAVGLSTPNDVADWENTALERLAKQRIRHILDYVKAWPHSTGAILDLRECMHSSEVKVLIATSFTQQLSRRMLHAGVTTSELLSIYINVIMAFKTLDPRGVLLDKVAVPLRAYLRHREDTVRIIAASFLADVGGNSDCDNSHVGNSSEEVCDDLAREINLSEGQALHVEHRGLDWDDMEWMPDPIDAGPDYKKSKSEDVMSFMLTLFEQADFLKEVQSLLGERLLTVGYDNTELEKESPEARVRTYFPQIRLVELFKARFGSDRLQSCEVMLRDIQDSRRINTTLRPRDDLPTAQEIHNAIPESGIKYQTLLSKFRARVPTTDNARRRFDNLVKSVSTTEAGSDMLYPSADQPMFGPNVDTGSSVVFYTQILSSFFWPSLREDDFAVPTPVSNLQRSFEQDFERIKNLRKLHWLPSLGKATVELELEDRTVKIEEVQTWQASVIYAFQNDTQDTSLAIPASKSVQDLEVSLRMDEVLVRNALTFWVGHRVLVEHEPDVFTVLEKLPSADRNGTSAPAAHGPIQTDTVISAVKSQDAVFQDNKPMYEMFMMGMLTNGGAMDAGRITMMMKMVVPGGYGFGEDETKLLLYGLEEQGKVVTNGSNYSVKK
ncbi:hypothetical protein E4T38_04013 [Aureobasidium subglaciale]|nr:hypothetical protein E4T38_04013 [Aureobasidium subglaciale]KAI5224876.1 hypothetical protein E4T40_03788 [Aureobasidium subglaciale]KAI5227890.1 hypothetical protein E4T41_04008 [Aureobasidium subglaciale]KAI5263558.1 hypothetical protein E4T46_03629 [Aureobasidium subglaciale]